MNIMHALGLNKNKQSGIIELISLLEQDAFTKKYNKIFFMVDGHPFPIPTRKKGMHFIFSRHQEADKLIIEKAKKSAPEKICIATSDNGIKKALRGLNIEFVSATSFRANKSAKKKNQKSKSSDEPKPQEWESWREKLAKLRFGDDS